MAVAACIVRDLDLIGKNCRKVSAIVNKTHGKVAKDKTLGFVSVHNLAKVSSRLQVSIDPLAEVTISVGAENLSGVELFDKVKQESSKQFRNHLMETENFQTLKDSEKVLSISPLAASSICEVDEETTDALVVVQSSNLDQGCKILSAVLKQFFHAGLGTSHSLQKSIVVEKVKIVEGDGKERLLPEILELP